MNIESKTTKQICQMVDSWYNEGSIASNFLNERWVSLVDAQKEITELKNKIKTLTEDYNELGESSTELFSQEQLQQTRAMKAEAKIEAANKILSSLPTHPNYAAIEEITQLRQVLQIPRKEKLTCDKTKEPPCHLEPSTELCLKCELNQPKR